MSESERRIDPRVSIYVPLRFRALNNPGLAEQSAESENISPCGIYFATSVPLEVGTPMEVSLRVPPAEKSTSDVKCVGRVVHVRQSSAPGGMTGIGFHIERYETKTPAPERWAS